MSCASSSKRRAATKIAHIPGYARALTRHSYPFDWDFPGYARTLTRHSYPFDWDFIPGTRADDGDPLDGVAVHDNATYPGVILPCRPLGVVDVTQKGKDGREQNPRLIVMSTWHDRLGDSSKG